MWIGELWQREYPIGDPRQRRHSPPGTRVVVDRICAEHGLSAGKDGQMEYGEPWPWTPRDLGPSR
jgi:hypothetical protein